MSAAPRGPEREHATDAEPARGERFDMEVNGRPLSLVDPLGSKSP